MVLLGMVGVVVGGNGGRIEKREKERGKNVKLKGDAL